MVIKAEPVAVDHGSRVFVYGTLKRLHSNHGLLEGRGVEGTKFLGACFIEGSFQMHDFTWFPGVRHVPGAPKINRIYGEVYRVSPDTLQALDILEGNGSFFTRVRVETPWKKAWVYTIPDSYDVKPVIPEGVWSPNTQERMFIASGKPMLTADEYFKMQPEL